MMQFKEFADLVNARVQERGKAQFGAAQDTTATWQQGGRAAEIELLEPRNFRLLLTEGGVPKAPTWYPIDANLVELTSDRIAKHLAG